LVLRRRRVQRRRGRFRLFAGLCCTAPVAEVSDVGFDSDTITVYWTPSGPNSVYDVARQDLDAMLTGAPLECLVTGLDAASYSDVEEPAAGAVYGYLVRANNDCGPGGWGMTSRGEPRTATCP
jgi:hypothetical protein